MKKVVITGSTGMIGSLVLNECLGNPEISQVITIDRKASGVSHEKLKEIIHDDFINYSKLENELRGVDVVYWCIGVYTGAVPKEEFRKITVDFTKVFAEELYAQSPNATFCFLSGAGADQSETSRIMFARDKGAAENVLKGIGFPKTYFFRPNYIYPVTPRKEPNLSYRLMRMLHPITGKLFSNGYVDSTALAHAMVYTGLQGFNSSVLENRDIKEVSKN